LPWLLLSPAAPLLSFNLGDGNRFNVSFSTMLILFLRSSSTTV
jgi:hypothetical protein